MRDYTHKVCRPREVMSGQGDPAPDYVLSFFYEHDITEVRSIPGDREELEQALEETLANRVHARSSGAIYVKLSLVEKFLQKTIDSLYDF